MTEDIDTYTYQITESIKERLKTHVKKHHSGNNKVDKEIHWDDIGRSTEQKQKHSKQGFLAEAVVNKFFEDIGIPSNWLGDKGEADFEIDGNITVDVKSRASTCKYRNLIKDDKISTSESVDMYFLTNVHYHPLETNQITAVELIGYIKNEEISRVGVELDMYGGNTSDKWEVETSDLNSVSNLRRLINLR